MLNFEFSVEVGECAIANYVEWLRGFELFVQYLDQACPDLSVSQSSAFLRLSLVSESPIDPSTFADGI